MREDILSTVIFMLISAVYTIAQTTDANERELEEWLPSSYREYKAIGQPLTRTVPAEATSFYIMSSKNYERKNSLLEIVIFDYQHAPHLLKKYTSAWAAMSTDDDQQKFSTTAVDGFTAWESTNNAKGTAQLYVNVKDRYLIFLSVTGNSIAFLKNVVVDLKPRQLPK